MIKEARELLRFSCSLYKKQIDGGRVFLHEHPANATSWQTQEISAVIDLEGVVSRRLDMCRYDLTTIDNDGNKRHVLKPTIILTNSEILGNHLSRRCFGEHKHAHLKGGDRCAKAAVYTSTFCNAVVEGFKLHLEKKRSAKNTDD